VSSGTWPGPRRSVEALAASRGRDAVVAGCLDLLAGREVDGSLIHGLGGPPARWAVHGGASGPDYWLRVWALRGLLWLWDDSATVAVVQSTTDASWRVREMAAKVVARHLVDDALPAVAELQQDRVARVRHAAERAVVRLTDAGR
jgi:HEAT repeat protein